MEDCNLKCVSCDSTTLVKDGKHNNMQRYRCKECGKRFDYGEYKGDYKTFTHFNIKLKVTDRNHISRENYCVPSNELSYSERKYLKFLIEHTDYEIPNEIYLDERHYTDEFVQEQFDSCMENYDLNMTFFNQLSNEKFSKHISSFVRKNCFKEVTDLKKLDGIIGIYILVLDNYKQIYIGQSTNIKKRILQHWTRKKEFDRLLCGDVDESIISIDSFGALDTTRIFYKSCSWSDLDKNENKYLIQISPDFCLNRVSGGINGEIDKDVRDVSLWATRKKRNLKFSV